MARIVDNAYEHFCNAQVWQSPGIYAIEVLPGVVKFGMSKNLMKRLRNHFKVLDSYGIHPLNADVVECQYPLEEEKDLLKRVSKEPGVRGVSTNSRETFVIPWTSAVRVLHTDVRS